MERAIAYSFLNMPVPKDERVSKFNLITLLEIEESGLIKLESCGPGYIVKIPFVFLRCYLETATDPFKKFWNEIFLGEEIYWQKWEVFNRNYFAFRLSLFTALGESNIPLCDFFHGCLTNLQDDFELLIPAMDDIKLVDAGRRYPRSRMKDLEDYSFILNADGAEFDGFVFIRVQRKGTKKVEKMILALQMKSSNSAQGQKITNKMIKEEYNKVKEAMDKFHKGVKFILVILGRCDFESKGKVKEPILPNNVVLVTMSEHEQFYGLNYLRRFKHRL